MTTPDDPQATAEDQGVSENRRLRVIDGRYELDLDRPLGGTRHERYLGQDRRSKRQVVGKTLRPEYRADAEIRGRFRREARMVAFLRHPNIVKVEAFVEEPDGLWVVLEHLGGGSLSDQVEARGAFSPEEVVPVLEQAADAIAEFHARGFVHGDLSASSLVYADDGRTLKLIDLGLAQPAEDGGVPERRVGADQSVDLHALGVIALGLLAGSFDPATNGSMMPLVGRVVNGRVLPAWLDDVMAPAVSKEPWAVYPDVRTLAGRYRAGVEGQLTGEPMELPPPEDRRNLAPVREDAQWNAEQPAAAVVEWPQGQISSATQKAPMGVRGISFAGFSAWLWRICAVLLAIDVAMAGALFVRDGAVPPFKDAPPGVETAGARLNAGGEAVVTGAGLVVRAEPSMGATGVGSLDYGATVIVTGAPVTGGDQQWWPVRFTRDGADVTGFVPDGWLQPAR